jgi:hypothetical protein
MFPVAPEELRQKGRCLGLPQGRPGPHTVSWSSRADQSYVKRVRTMTTRVRLAPAAVAQERDAPIGSWTGTVGALGGAGMKLRTRCIPLALTVQAALGAFRRDSSSLSKSDSTLIGTNSDNSTSSSGIFGYATDCGPCQKSVRVAVRECSSKNFLRRRNRAILENSPFSEENSIADGLDNPRIVKISPKWSYKLPPSIIRSVLNSQAPVLPTTVLLPVEYGSPRR